MLLNKQQNGFAIIEIMVTVLIVTVGVSGMGLLLLRAVQATQDTAQRSQAIWIVEDYVGRIRANPEGARAGQYVLDPEDIDCDFPPVNLCAETFQNGSEVPAADCSDNTPASANLMATFDNWISTCGLSSTIFDSPSDFVLEPKLTSNCTKTIERQSTYLKANGTNDCVQYLVSINWKTRRLNESKNEAERINENNYSVVVGIN